MVGFPENPILRCKLVSRRLLRGVLGIITCGRRGERREEGRTEGQKVPDNPMGSSKAKMPLLSGPKSGGGAGPS